MLPNISYQRENIFGSLYFVITSDLNQYNIQEGVGALWTGLGPNIARNGIINAAELASYDQVKQVISM